MDYFILFLGIALVPTVFSLDYNVTNRENFAYQVSLRREGRHICGGTVYGRKYILTTASCVNNTRPMHWEVVTGFLNLQKPLSNYTQSLHVDKIYVHENYTSKSADNNIALVKLVQELKYDNYTHAVPIARKWSFFESSRCVVSGWGANGTQLVPSYDLRFANVTVGVQGQCSYYRGYVHDNMICAGAGAQMRNPCTGDLGGPLVCNNTLYGIVSWWGRCETDFQPGMYTNVTHFAKWISDTSKTNGAGINAASPVLMLSVGAVLFNLFRD